MNAKLEQHNGATDSLNVTKSPKLNGSPFKKVNETVDVPKHKELDLRNVPEYRSQSPSNISGMNSYHFQKSNMPTQTLEGSQMMFKKPLSVWDKL